MPSPCSSRAPRSSRPPCPPRPARYRSTTTSPPARWPVSLPADAAAGGGQLRLPAVAAHPDPVILVNGTFANQDDNWQAASPLLANHGYCVFTFNYGGSSASSIVQGTGDIAASAGQLASFVTRVLAATGAAKVDLVGHSQGGMMPRYYLMFLAAPPS